VSAHVGCLPVSELGKNGVRKDSDFEPAHLLAKGNGSPPQNATEAAAPGTPFVDYSVFFREKNISTVSFKGQLSFSGVEFQDYAPGFQLKFILRDGFK
jgi:hypothetical protein